MIRSSPVCRGTLIVTTITQKISMFLVMLLSITRTLAIALPYHKIRNAVVMATIIMFGVALLIIDSVYLGEGWLHPTYRKWLAFCIFEIPEDEKSPKYFVYTAGIQMELLIPGFIVFISFVVGTCTLLRQSKPYPIPGEEEGQNRRISITIAIFTAVFLLCNLPYFLTQLVYLFDVYSLKFQRPISEDPMFRWYAGLVSFIFTVLNAALNPCLYFLCMPQYRTWLTFLFQNPHRIRTILTEPSRSASQCFDRFGSSLPRFSVDCARHHSLSPNGSYRSLSISPGLSVGSRRSARSLLNCGNGSNNSIQTPVDIEIFATSTSFSRDGRGSQQRLFVSAARSVGYPSLRCNGSSEPRRSPAYLNFARPHSCPISHEIKCLEQTEL